MTPVHEGGQPVLQLPYDGGYIEREQLAVAHEDAAVDDRGADVGGAGAVQEGRGEVVHGPGVRPGEVDEDDVGPAARCDGPDRVAESDRPRALERCVVKGLTGRQPAWVALGGLLDQRGEGHRLPHIKGV